MAAELFPTKKPAPVSTQTSGSAVQQYQQQNISNNNTIQGCNWQGLYPSIRERYPSDTSFTLLSVSEYNPTVCIVCIVCVCVCVCVCVAYI